MTKRKRIYPRCSGACRDGSQCGRRVIDGSQPPTCHLHQPGAEHPSPIIPPSDEIDEIKILKRLARDPNPQVRLKAVDLLLDLKRKDEATRSPQRQHNPWDALIEQATEPERAELFGYFDRVKDWRTRVAGVVLDVPSSEPTPAPIASAPIEEPEPEPAPIEEPEPEPAWTPERYEATGFVWSRELRIWQHPLGDDIGDQIVSGAIDLDTAQQMADAAAAQSRSLHVASKKSDSSLRRFGQQGANS